MRDSRKQAIRTVCRIIERNYDVVISGGDEDEMSSDAVSRIGKAAFDTMVDEIELALKEYAYMVNDKIKR